MQKTDIKELISVNLRNYGLMFLFLFSEIIITVVLQLLLRFDAMTATIITDLILCVVPLTLFLKFRRNNIKGFEYKGSLSTGRLLKYTIFFIFIAFITNVLFTWFANNFPDPGMESRQDSISNNSLILYLVVSLIIAPIQEESLMRLWLYNMVKSRSFKLVATFVTALTFGIMHGTSSHLVFATMFAILLTFILEYTQVWYISILGHYVYNWTTALSGLDPTNSIRVLASSSVASAICFAIFLMIIITFGFKAHEASMKSDNLINKTEA